MAHDQLHRRYWEGKGGMRYIWARRGASRTRKSDAHWTLKYALIILPFPVLMPHPPNVVFWFLLPLSSTYNLPVHPPTNLSRGDSTCRNETKECNSNTGSRIILRFSSFRETYSAKSRVLFLKYFQFYHEGKGGRGCRVAAAGGCAHAGSWSWVKREEEREGGRREERERENGSPREL